MTETTKRNLQFTRSITLLQKKTNTEILSFLKFAKVVTGCVCVWGGGGAGAIKECVECNKDNHFITNCTIFVPSIIIIIIITIIILQ